MGAGNWFSTLSRSRKFNPRNAGKRIRHKVALVCALLLSGSVFAEQQKQINILFVGNSFTFRHNLNLLVEDLFEEGQPGLNVHTERLVYGGQDMYHHATFYFSQTFIEQSTIDRETVEERIRKMEEYLKLESPPETFLRYWKDVRGRPSVTDFPRNHITKAIRDHRSLLAKNPRTKWDYVVLQSWQDVDPDLNRGYAKYATILASAARKQGARVILYITAPGNQNALPLEGPMDQAYADQQMKVIAELKKDLKPFAVVPVPLAINMIQQEGTELTFRYVNDFHPNQTCAFLTASMFYAAFFGESTVGFNFNSVTETNPKGQAPGRDPDGNDAAVVFDEKAKTYLQDMAYRAVMAFNKE